ncbi:unnamed protein product [Caenorhabditis sp. 36 PRJEB53466]|nr:unnamed protein product [Caenorhabditis sp. 36 PRJEB53466]
MICVDCGGVAYNNTELCENCMDINRTGTMSLKMARECDMSMSCAACRRMITDDSRRCSMCRKHYHRSCDSSDASALDGFICASCRRHNPMLADDLGDVLLSESATPRGNAPLSPFSDPQSQIALQMPSGPMTSSYPMNDFGVDMYSQMMASSSSSSSGVQQMLNTQAQLMDEISDGGATNDSDRNSSPFYQETSDYDEDFVPNVSTRGRGRGGGKKKPGRGQTTSARRQTNPPPSGYFSATNFQSAMSGEVPNPFGMGRLPSLAATVRGKRGKRGATTSARGTSSTGKGPGRGRGRGRGSAAQAAAVLQQVQFASGMGGLMMFNSGGQPMHHVGNGGLPMGVPSPSVALPPSVLLPAAASSSSSSAAAPQHLPPALLPAQALPPSAAAAAPIPIEPQFATSSSEVPNFQQIQIPTAIREVDEQMLEDEASRQSGGSKSEEAEYIRTAVVCRVNDEFLQKACMCLVCGSIGKGAEASMVACSNCAQTYHTYCVNLHDKLNSAVLTRGWRCLDCTVCEGCGTGGDESNLLLCDECDVSYHIYHMKPPLDRIPPGSWRCQWCSRCRRCNHKTTSGNDLTTEGLCFPCSSLKKCPKCAKGYQLNEKIIRCTHCSKWRHGACEGLFTDEQLEQAVNSRMRCSDCRPNRQNNTGSVDSDPFIFCDSVALNKNADEVLKSKYAPAILKSQMLEIHGYRESFDHYDDGDSNVPEDSQDPSAPQPSIVQRGRGRGNPGGRRGMNRIGVGGFYAKLPRHRIQALEEALALAGEDDDTKKKRPRKPRRSYLEDAYPPAIQEAFFGMKGVDGKALVDVKVDEPVLFEYEFQRKKVEPQLSATAAEMLRNDISENAFLDNIDVGNIEIDDDFDFSLLFDDDDEELEDSLQGDTNQDGGENRNLGPTTFGGLDQQPSTSTAVPHGGFQMPGMHPPNIAQQAPGVRAAQTISRSGSQSTDASERYQFAERWEEDEPLGLQATTAAVLYANERHGYLKEQFPEWTDRVKQIQKMWRNLNQNERQQYVNRARENRTLRGKIPRPRRQNVHSTNSVDSPTVQSPAPHRIGFRVPANPGENSGLGGIGAPGEDPNLPPQPKQVRITCHLNPDQYQQWQELLRIKSDLERLVLSCETDLARSRKQKKNLAAKKRSMIKTAQAAPDYDGRPLDLNEHDQQQLVMLTDHIKSKQGDVEKSKRDLKTHEALLNDFEKSCGVLRNETDVSMQMIEQSNLRNAQYAQSEAARIQQVQAQGLQGPPGIGGPPPHHPMQMGMPHPQHPQHPQHAQQQQQAQAQAQAQAQQQQRMMQFGVQMMRPGPPGVPGQPYIVRPPPNMTPQQHAEWHRRIIIETQMAQRRANRAPVMGGIRYESITDPVLRDCYEFLDEVIHDISVHLSQQQHQQQLPPPTPHMLKRPLQLPGVVGGQAPPLHMMMPHMQPGPPPPGVPGGPLPPQQLAPPPGAQPPPQMALAQQPGLSSQDDGPKPKKKRTIQKKTASSYSAGGEYDSYLEKMRTRFRLCPEIPKHQREPKLTHGGSEFVNHGMTDMVVKPGKMPLIGKFGRASVKRGTRMFLNEDATSKQLVFSEPSLYQMDPQIRLVALYNSSGTQTENDEIFQDEMDRRCGHILNPNATIHNLMRLRRPIIDHVRSRAKYMEEAKAPLRPALEMWEVEPKKEEDVPVEMVFNTENLTPESTVDEKKELIAKFHEQFKELLGIKQEIEWKMEDTPPDSPAPSSPEPEDIKNISRRVSSRAPSASVEKEIKREIEDETMAENEGAGGGQYKCRQCQKLGDGAAPVRLKADKLGILAAEATSEEKEETVTFCSRKCYYELMATSKVALTPEELAVAEQNVDEETLNRLKQIHLDSIVKAVTLGKPKAPCAPSVSSASLLSSGEGMISPRDTRFMMDEGRKEHLAFVSVLSLIGAVEPPKEAPTGQRSSQDDWKPYEKTIYDSFAAIQYQQQQYVLAPKIGVAQPPHDLDKRLCVFCGGVGDGETSKCGRLITLTEYYWVHVNCALWSPEVYERPSGALTNVDKAVLRAAQSACELCKLPGASVKCHKVNCGVNYHLLCAMQTNGHFIHDRTFFCKMHSASQDRIVVRLDALRRIFVERDENQMLMRLFDLTDGDRLCLRLGAFTFHKLGSIVPKQLKTFHNKDFIFPNQYKATRLFWSPKNPRERMLFECTIEDRNNQPLFIVKSLEDPSICVKAPSATGAWLPIYKSINQLREQHGEVLKFFGSQIVGETLFGLNEMAICKITESLPGFDTVYTYTMRHQNSPVLELPLAENPSGCARSEPRNRTIGQHFRTRPQPMGGTSHHHHGMSIAKESGSASSSSHDLQTRQAATSLTSANSGRTRGVRSYYTEEAAARARAFGISPDLAMNVRFEPIQNTQAAFSAYQKMRREWKDRVYLARSRIAGLGLYAKIDIGMGEYIIEYKGEIIRSEVCEVREIRYTAQNRGVYMFRIDEEWVIDATMAGGPARYVNHSCDPNCSTQIMDAGSGPREKKIIITANRPISAGEELTYDYQFELEDSTDKIPCLCGAPNCVKWMN